MHIARAIRDNNFRIPDKIPGVILNHTHTYPYLYHLILAFFPEKSRIVFERMSSAIFDTISILILYFFVDWVSGFFLHSIPNFALWFAVLLAISPPLLMVSRGPRAYRGTPRVFGQTLYFLHITTFFFFYTTGDIAALIVSLVSASLIFISAKFGVQVLVLFGIFFGIFFSPMYLLYLILSYVLMYLLSFGRVVKVTEGQLRYNEFYVKLMKSKGYLRGFASDLVELKIFLSRLKRNFISAMKGKVLDFITWVLSERYFLYFLLIAFPQVIFLLFVIYKIDIAASLFAFMMVWLIASLFWFLLTSFNYLRFLGQGERYLEYGLPASLFLSLYYLLSHGLENVVVIFIFYSVIVYLVHIRIFIKNSSARNENHFDDQKVFDFLKVQEKGVVLPIHSEWETLYRTQLPMLFYGSNIDLRKIPIAEFNSIYHNMHSPTANIVELVERFKVKYIISTHSHLREYLSEVLKNEAKFFNLADRIFESKNFVLFKVINKDGTIKI